MKELLDMVRRTVREELALRRGPQLATVTALTAHESDDDTANYEADVRLKHDGLEIAQVPIAVPHVGAAAPPRVGDLVLVEFLDYDIQQPLVTGRFYHDQERAPLFKQDDVLFEHRVPDGTVNHLRFANDGSIFLQRDVKKLEDNSDFLAGIRIDPQGLIELKTSDDLVVTLDQQNGKISVLCKDKPVEITCDKLTMDADVEIKKTLTVDGDGTIKGTGKISSVTISGTDISGGGMMADLTLKGTLNLMGTLTFKPSSGGKVKIGASGLEALVEVTPSDPPQGSSVPPVILPPPPAAPLQPQPTVWIVNSFNKTVKAGSKNIVALGMAMQGQSGAPMWPGMVLPGSSTVKINQISINVANDQAVIFPSGGTAKFDASGQP